MKFKNYIGLTILFLSLTATGQTKFAINYNIGIPTGETSDLFDGVSWRGVNMDFSYFINESIAIGLSGGWQVFDDGLGYVTETNGTETISGYRYNYLNSVPLYGTGSYYFNTGRVEPYAALGIGIVYNQLDQDIGLINNEEEAWQFSLRPELGVDFSVNYGLSLRGSVRYHYVAETDDVPDLSYLSIGLGLIWSR